MTEERHPEDSGRHGRLVRVVLDAYDDLRLPRLERIRIEVAGIATTLQTLGFSSDDQGLEGDGRSRTLRDRFQSWRPDARRILLYWAGHARPEGVDEFYLCCRDTVGHPGTGNAISGTELGQWLADKNVDAIVVVVDACNAGGGAREIFTAFDKRTESRAYPLGRRPRLAVMSGAQRHQQAREAVFARTLIEVLEHGPPPATESYLPWGEHDAYLTPTEVADAVAERLHLSGVEQIPECKGTVGNFFPNPRHLAFSPDVEVEAKRRRGAWLPADVHEHFMVKFRGIDTADERGWYFTGRQQPLREIVGWLHSAQSGLLVVTGPPGCGKSAVLGRLAILSDEGYRKEAGKAGALKGLSLDTDPKVGSITAGIHAKNKTLLDCVGELADALEIASPFRGWQSAGELVSAVGRRKQPVTVLLDALDEARPADLSQIARDLLRELANLAHVRVLVGTRPDRARPDQGFPKGEDGPLLRALAADMVVQLDADLQAKEAVAAYTEQRLQEIPGSPYHGRPDRARAAAEEIAAHSERIFLFGRLLARTLARRSGVLDLSSAEAHRLLRGGVYEAFAYDLARYGPDQRRVRNLLTPLAWAEGTGLPRRQIWLTLANALADPQSASYDERDLAWVLEQAGAHLIESGEDGQTVYRLYHQAFNDYLRHGHDEATVQGAITDALLALTGPPGEGDWSDANPYLHRHLATHAAAAGRLADLVTDPRYLLYADPLRLARVLGTIDHNKHVLARLYWRALDRIRDAAPVERAAAMHATALDDEPTAVPLLHTEAELPWRGLWASSPPTPFHRRLTGHTDGVNTVAIGQLAGRTVIVSGGDDRTVRVWDADTGEQQALLSGHTDRVRAVAIGQAAGRTLIVSGGNDQTVRVWDAPSGQQRAIVHHIFEVGAVAIGDIASRTVIVSCDGTVRVWDAESYEQQAVVPDGHTDWVRAVAIGQVAGRAVIVSGANDRTVRVRVADTGTDSKRGEREEITVLSGHTGGVRAVAIGQLRRRAVIASGASDRTVRVWDADTGEQKGVVPGNIRGVNAVAIGIAAGRSVIVSGGIDDGMVRVWDAESGQQKGTLPCYTGVNAVAIGEVVGRAVIVSGGSDGTVRIWDPKTNGERQLQAGFLRRPAHTDEVNAVAIGHAGAVIVSGSSDRTVRIWDAASGKLRLVLRGHIGVVRAVAIGEAMGRSVIVSGGADGTVRIWSPASRKRQRILRGHIGVVRAVAIGEAMGRSVIVSGGADGTVRIWDAASGKQQTVLFGYADRGRAVAIGQAGHRTVVVVGSVNGVQVVELLPLAG